MSSARLLGRGGLFHLSKCYRSTNTPPKRPFSRTSIISFPADPVVVSVEDGVRKVVLNRPKAKNAMSYEVMDKLGCALFESNNDSFTRIVTVTGAGDFFSSGSDFNNLHPDKYTSVEVTENSRRYAYRQMMLGFINCRKPIVAMVNGPAIGAGATLLPFCDQVLASDKAFFLTPFSSIGILPEFASTYTFPKIMGIAKANDMLLFGNKITAKEALGCGLVSKVIPSESFNETCQEFVNSYSKLPLEPLLIAKELIRAPEREKLCQLAAYEMNLGADAVDSPHVRNTIEKFFSKKSK